MNWWWRKPKPPPTIPPYRVPVQEHKPKSSNGIVVEERDTSNMTATGVHKAWKKESGQP
jgi:hypothetical protein